MMWTHFHDRHGNTWPLGSLIAVTMHDRQRFTGFLEGIHPDYLIIDGCGFPVDDILDADSPIARRE